MAMKRGLYNTVETEHQIPYYVAKFSHFRVENMRIVFRGF